MEGNIVRRKERKESTMSVSKNGGG